MKPHLKIYIYFICLSACLCEKKKKWAWIIPCNDCHPSEPIDLIVQIKHHWVLKTVCLMQKFNNLRLYFLFGMGWQSLQRRKCPFKKYIHPRREEVEQVGAVSAEPQGGTVSLPLPSPPLSSFSLFEMENIFGSGNSQKYFQHECSFVYEYITSHQWRF